MHPGLALLNYTALGVALAAAMFFLHSFHEMHQQEEAYRVYARHASEFERREPEEPARDAELVQRLLDEVEIVLQELRSMPPGAERNRRIRLLRSRYHPDRNAHLASLRHVFDEVAAIVNARTDPLLV